MDKLGANTMTKDLSKQICEKCGIEYYKQGYHLIDGGGVIPIDRELDFGQPENFVKLFNLLLPEMNTTIGGFVQSICRPSDVCTSTDFIQYVNHIINNENIHADIIRQMQIKQSIREAEWKYE